MYCSLEDAFPHVQKRASCWQGGPKTTAEKTPDAVGAQVSVAPQITTQPVHFEGRPELQHVAFVHHCLSCPVCTRILWLHFEDLQQQQSEEGRRKSRRRRSRRVTAASVLENQLDVSWVQGTLLIIFAGLAGLIVLNKLLK